MLNRRDILKMGVAAAMHGFIPLPTPGIEHISEIQAFPYNVWAKVCFDYTLQQNICLTELMGNKSDSVYDIFVMDAKE